MTTTVIRLTPNSDGVTDIWYESRGTLSASIGPTVRADEPIFYYALGSPQRTLRPNYDRRTEYPTLP